MVEEILNKLHLIQKRALYLLYVHEGRLKLEELMKRGRYSCLGMLYGNLQLLADLGLVKFEMPFVELTEEGSKVAKEIYNRARIAEETEI